MFIDPIYERSDAKLNITNRRHDQLTLSLNVRTIDAEEYNIKVM
jgi:hypothetical protein